MENDDKHLINTDNEEIHRVITIGIPYKTFTFTWVEDGMTITVEYSSIYAKTAEEAYQEFITNIEND